MTICIYRITNNINGKTYIGQHKTKSILDDDGYMGSGKLLHRAFEKYGIENFTKTIITICKDRNEANALEEFYIRKEKNENSKGCYNIADGSYGGNLGKDVNKKHSICNKMRGIKPPSAKGRHLSEETRRKISEANKGKKMFFRGMSWKIEDGKRVWFTKGE